MNTKRIKRRDFSEGQSMVEYIVLLAIVIAILLIFLRPGGKFQGLYNKVIEQQGDDMLNAAVEIFN